MIAIIDYDAGNTCSVMNALNRIGAPFILSDDHEIIQRADKVIFPGVGHAAAAMEALQKKDLVEVIRSLAQPVLGICVGMQLLCDHSEEGDTKCLGIIPGSVRRFDPKSGIKVPHMGWNIVKVNLKDEILKGISDDDYFYFVHSYYVPLNEETLASCDYNGSFSAIVRKDNFYGIQFHAEKSGSVGEQLITNFLSHDI